MGFVSCLWPGVRIDFYKSPCYVRGRTRISIFITYTMYNVMKLVLSAFNPSWGSSGQLAYSTRGTDSRSKSGALTGELVCMFLKEVNTHEKCFILPNKPLRTEKEPQYVTTASSKLHKTFDRKITALSHSKCIKYKVWCLRNLTMKFLCLNLTWPSSKTRWYPPRRSSCELLYETVFMGAHQGLKLAPAHRLKHV